MMYVRQALWERLRGRSTPWDVIVIGGGVTGAAVLREAARRNLAALLIEQRDFSWGTSSRSSRMVHGGLRYIAQGDIKLTRDAVRERERLLAEAPGLVERMRYYFPHRRGRPPGRYTFSAALALYDFFALRREHGYVDRQALRWRIPYLAEDGLTGASYYTDAVTDDARLVLRLLHEAGGDGGTAINYASAETILRHGDGSIAGVRLRDAIDGTAIELRAGVVINATGVWADRVRGAANGDRKIRPLRGSHLIFPSWRFPLFEPVALTHPRDRRVVFMFPWEGATIVGTTDLDHDRDLDEEPRISPAEVAYLLEAVAVEFPGLKIRAADAIASYAGVRPVIGTGRDPSKERRDHAVWRDRGLISVSGGKLTTCRLIALDALRAAGMLTKNSDVGAPLFDRFDAETPAGLSDRQWRRLTGRYGEAATQIVAGAHAGELECVPGTPTLWAELRFAAAAEAVVHLDDLLLRRTRLGLLLPGGAEELLPSTRAIAQTELRWSDQRWIEEEHAYRALWRHCYRVPEEAEDAGE